MKSSFKNLLLFLAAFLAAIVLQFLAAFSVMLPVVMIKQMQILQNGLGGTQQELQIMEQLSLDMISPIMLVTHIMLLTCFALWYLLGCCDNRKAISTLKTAFQGKKLLIVILIAAGGCYLTNFAMPLASMIIPESVMQSYLELMEQAGFGESMLTTIAAVLIAPFGEELIFRGVCCHYACGMVKTLPNRRKAFYIANTIQALGFGVFHGNLIQGIYAFVLGLLLGYLRERCGSIWAPILGHMIVNSISSFLWEPLFLILPDALITFVIGTIISFAVVVCGLKLGGPAVKQQ